MDTQFKLMPKNGKTIKKLDYYDREIIKAYCKKSNMLKSEIDLENNTCKLYTSVDNKLVYFADIVKVINKNLFYLVTDFYCYINRNPIAGEKPKKVKIPSGTSVFINDKNPQQVWVPVNEDELILIPRYVLVKNAEIRQSRNLYLSNPDLNIGIGDGQAKYDICIMALSEEKGEQCILYK